MKSNVFRGLAICLLLGVFTVMARSLPAQADGVVKPLDRINLAPVAHVTTSYVSGHETITALNDNSSPAHSDDKRRGAYGNWPRSGFQWVQYEWSQPISTNRIDVYWFDDQRGVRLPKSCRLLYWDGNTFIPVKNVDGLGLERDRFNTTTFDAVETTRLRLEIESNERFSTGILEWRVVDTGESPPFPPIVSAGVDRVMVRGGKTYLNGTVENLLEDDEPISVAWSKVSGPGTVAFSETDQAVTTATFSITGVYELRLTAGHAPLTASATLRVNVIESPPATHLDLVDTGYYAIDSPFWNSRIKALIVNWIPHCIDKISDPDLKEGGINNLVDAAKALAGEPHGDHRGYVFSNAWIYNTIESICLALMIDAQGDLEILAAQQSMRATLEDWIPKVLAAQEADGYLQTAFTLSDRQRWSPRTRADHEGYVAGYLLEAAVAHYIVTRGSDTRLYDAAKRLADCWDAHIGPAPKQPWYDGHQAMEIGLVRFGRFVSKVDGTGRGNKYIALAKFLLDCRQNGSKYDQSHVPVVQQYEAVGHAVRASYSYAGMADVALETQDVDYHNAVMSLWDNLVNRKYYITGGIGSGETSEGFGPDYSLPHNAYCESCSSCGEIFFQHKLNLTYDDARYADLYEETLYNALLGSLDLAGRNFYYQNPLDASGPRYDWHVCPCCVGNIPRTLLMLPTWMYAKGPAGISINLFVGSTVTIDDVVGTEVQLVQTTDYPWSGDISITVNPEVERSFVIRIRAPQRDVSRLYTGMPESNGIRSITVNGESIDPVVQDGYAEIQRTWKQGDRIDIQVPMEIQRVTTIDKVQANAGRVALRRGPLIYNIESVDQDIDQVLAADAKLSTAWRPDLLGGVMVIQGSFADGSPLLAIPNYARLNRGGRSIVWIKDR